MSFSKLKQKNHEQDRRNPETATHSTLREEFDRRRRAIQRRKKPTPRIIWSDSDSDSVDTFTAITRRIAERNKLRWGNQRNRIDLNWSSESDSGDDVSIRQMTKRNVLRSRMPLDKSNKGYNTVNGEEGESESLCRQLSGLILTDMNGKKHSTRTSKLNKSGTAKTRMHTPVQIHNLKDREDSPRAKDDSTDTYHAKRDDSSISETTESFNYNDTPKIPEELDAHELSVYDSLVAWRYQLKNEAGVEAFNKNISNRTLVELTRRRRNDKMFARRRCVDEETAKEDLLTIWGIGKSKAAPDGVAGEMLDVLDSKSNRKQLRLSREIEEQRCSAQASVQKVSHKGRRKQTTSSTYHNIPSPVPNIPRSIVFSHRKV